MRWDSSHKSGGSLHFISLPKSHVIVWCLKSRQKNFKFFYLGLNFRCRAVWIKIYSDKEIVKVWFKTYYQIACTKLYNSRNEINRWVVPQGSVLGPVLFILITNDMRQYLGTCCSPLMYVDDTTLLVVAEPSSNNLAVNAYTALRMAFQYCHTLWTIQWSLWKPNNCLLKDL